MKSPSPITTIDYDRVMALWEAAGLPCKPDGRDSREAFARQLKGNQSVFGVEADDGQLIGVIVATHDERKGWLNRLAVHPDYRRQGIGRQLIAVAEDWLRAQGLEIFTALIEDGNMASLELFLSEGYIDWPSMHYVSKRDRDDI